MGRIAVIDTETTWSNRVMSIGTVIVNGLSAAETAQRMKAFLNKVPHPKDRILLIAPPPMKRGE